jgi:type I restriction enzyme, S subunit
VSRINELITKLCPNGVEYKAVSDVADYVRGVTYSKHEEQADGPIHVLRSNNITLSSNTLNFDDVKNVSANVRVRKDQHLYANDILISAASGSKAHVGKVAYIWDEIDYVFGGFMAVLRANRGVEPRFLFHLLIGRTFAEYLEKKLSTTTINNLNSSVVGAFRIPVPPVEVQREIVRVLDLFTGLEAELEVKLDAEREARQLQYTYYRDRLFAFLGAKDVHRVPMGELGKFIRGRRFTKDDVVDDGIPSIHYGEIYTHYGVATTSTASHVRRELAGQLRYAQHADVVIAVVGETVEDVAKAVAWLGDEPVAIHDDTFLFRSEMNPKFVAYYMQSAEFHSQKNKYVARAKVKRLSGESLAKISIPVPSPAEQERVVSILDRFDVLVSDQSVTLPAEVSARRKQYEHYRDRLLTFRELTA